MKLTKVWDWIRVLEGRMEGGVGWDGCIVVSQQDSEIAHYHEIYLALPLHPITARQRELKEDLVRTEQNEPLNAFNNGGGEKPVALTDD